MAKEERSLIDPKSVAFLGETFKKWEKMTKVDSETWLPAVSTQVPPTTVLFAALRSKEPFLASLCGRKVPFKRLTHSHPRMDLCAIRAPLFPLSISTHDTRNKTFWVH